MLSSSFEMQPPSPGKLLVSEPFLADYNFKRSVILLCSHSDEGSVGFILNKPLDLKLKDVLATEIYADVPLFLGGPVENNTLHYIHREEKLAESSEYLGDGLYWGGNFEQVLNMLNSGQIDLENFRFFLGYSGWGSLQLNNELNEKTWIVTSSSTDIIFQEDDEQMWRNVLRNMGGTYKVLANSPESPFLN